jgi:hypothetical protein
MSTHLITVPSALKPILVAGLSNPPADSVYYRDDARIENGVVHALLAFETSEDMAVLDLCQMFGVCTLSVRGKGIFEYGLELACDTDDTILDVLYNFSVILTPLIKNIPGLVNLSSGKWCISHDIVRGDVE